ncbi:coatomer subunit beta' [Nematocida major]|uniref:coatomer subunit beta' n=1 Tax=Nematocida major TaxID=1912982 RepID=UPI0020085CE0|nr:coatomer subunit beta' [Nematocida major]KAH9386687.1 coatomer subunit beta' [Nematocida major]
MEERIAGRFEKARVKQVVSHKKEPLALAVMYNGDFELWNTIGMNLIKTGSIGEIPVRAAAFVEDCECFAVGGDDGMLRLYCTDSFKLKHKVQAHTDFIRYIAVHPVLPYIATCSDDMQIKIWDYSKEVSLIKTLSGHTHFVMCVDFSSKENKTLISCSLDHNIIVWNIETGAAVKTLKGTGTPLNTVKYIADKHIVSGGDDGKINIWDGSLYTPITSVSGHMGPVTSVCCTSRGFVSAGEDGLVREWSKKSFRPESSVSARVQRVWGVCAAQGGDLLAGGDEGISFVRQTQSSLLYSFISTKSEGRVVISDSTQIKQIKTSNPGAAKIVTTLSYVPDRMCLSENGRYLSVESDGMAYIYTVLGFLLQVSVPGHSLVWTGLEEFVIVHGSSLVRYTDFEVDGKVALSPELDGSEIKSVKKVDAHSMLIKTESTQYLVGLKGNVLMEVPEAEGVYAYNNVYVLLYKDRADIVGKNGSPSSPDSSLSCRISSWCGKDNVVFLHTGSKIEYFVLSEKSSPTKMHAVTLGTLPASGVLLGVVAGGVWCLDGGKVFEHSVQWGLVKYQSMIISGNVPSEIPKEHLKECIHFLMGMGMLEEAYRLADDPDEKFELLVKLGKLSEAMRISNTETKHSRLAELFVRRGHVREALQCAQKGVSVENEVLLAALCNSMEDLKKGAEKACQQGKGLVALAAAYRTENYELCRKVLRGGEFEKLFCKTHGGSAPGREESRE